MDSDRDVPAEDSAEDFAADEASTRRQYVDMDVPSLLSLWDDPLPESSRSALRAELKERGVRTDESDLPTGADVKSTPPGSGSGKARSKKRIATAVKWILAIGILQMVFGVGFGMVNNGDVNAARDNLAGFADDEIVVTEGGEEWVVSELRSEIDKEQIAAFVVPIGIGLVFIGLYYWGRRSPLPAMITALVLFVGVHALSAVADPETLMRGVIMKVLFTMALVRGVREVLASQESMDGGAMDGPASA